MKKNNRKLASYIAEVLGDEYEEAEAEEEQRAWNV